MESDANAEVLRLVQTVRYAVIVLSALPIMSCIRSCKVFCAGRHDRLHQG